VRVAETSGSYCNKESSLREKDYGPVCDLIACLSNKSSVLDMTKNTCKFF
jgi:hypothetical protein